MIKLLKINPTWNMGLQIGSKMTTGGGQKSENKELVLWVELSSFSTRLVPKGMLSAGNGEDEG